MRTADRLVVRVDAGPEVGTGHAMRCLALAQGWKDAHGEVTFAQAETLPSLEKRLAEEGFESISLHAKAGGPEDAEVTARLARDRSAAWTVIDGYRFDESYQRALKSAGLRVLAIDDFGHAGRYAAELVVNQNAGADASLYGKAESGMRLLLGPRYVMLQRGFRSLRKAERAVAVGAKHVLVTFGGVDAQDVSSKVLRALRRLEPKSFQVRLVIGPGNPRASGLEAEAKGSPVRVHVDRDPESLAGGMDWADLAVAGAGTTSWELAYMGVPMLLIATADNQRRVAEGLADAGAAINLGWHAETTEERIAESVRSLAADAALRSTMSRRGRALVDGQGVSRVVTEMKAALLDLRPVVEGDARLLWEWANDPIVRAVSFTADSIPWDHHVRWLSGKLADPATRFFLASDRSGEPLGQIRFDITGDEAEVSVSLDAKHRGKGDGSALILAGSRKLFAASRVRTIQAYVKDGNEASVQAFLKAGYTRNGRATVRGHEALRFSLRREAIA